MKLPLTGLALPGVLGGGTVPWYLSGGVAKDSVIAAYAPSGAASYAASLVNLANPGTDNAAEGTAPAWDTVNGWKVNNLSGNYLILPKFALTYTIICKYSNATGQNRALFGALTTGGTYYTPVRQVGTRAHVNGANNADGVVTDHKEFGVVAIAGNKAYTDGVDLGVTLATGTLPDKAMHVGRVNYTDPLSMITANIQYLAIYNTTLTAPQIAAITNKIGIPSQVTPTDADIFLIGGQSNGAGYVTALQNSYNDKSMMYGKSYTLRRMGDPISTNAGAVEAKMSDASGCATKGSVWPLVADAIATKTGRYVIFAPCAIGGEGLSTHWMPGADHRDATTDYGCLVRRADALTAAGYGTIRGVLMWCGEGEVNSEMSENDYNGYLDTFANAIDTDLGVPTMYCKLQNCAGAGAGSDETNVNNAVATAWADNDNCITGPDLFSIATDDEWHIKETLKAIDAADRWADAIIAAFGW